MKIALCGNPNVGKTTLFNRLTRSDAPVGNWHGVTVGVTAKRVSKTDTLFDLPGSYSLTARTKEEEVTRDNILCGEYDCFLYVAEVNNLRRNLYMLMQLIEADKPVALVVNMMDEARGKVDLKLLEARLGIPVVGTSVKSKNPKLEILQAAERAVKHRPVPLAYLKTPQITALASKLTSASEKAGLNKEFCALKILERDGYIESKLGIKPDASCAACGACANIDMPAQLRYEHIRNLLEGVCESNGKILAVTNKIDRIVLGKLALPIFLAVMTAVFVITFEAGKPLSDALVGLVELLDPPIMRLSAPEWVKSLLSDGVVAGVGGVLAFLPQVVILYLLTALLQDSGYMSRVAFVTDDFFKKFGLSGRAAFSVVLGLGCSASAVLTSRGISGENARRRAALVTPFCPCSARLAVFVAISSYFSISGVFVAALYLLGFTAALVVLKLSALKTKATDGDSLIMEMPPYRLPGIKRVAGVVLRNTLSFVVRVGTTVFAVSVIMWALCNFSIGYGYTGGADVSVMNTFAGIIAPVFGPLGFGNWKATAALISGVAAKETVISVITSLGGMGDVFGSRIAAMSFSVFTCLYVPCVATLSALAKETGIKTAALSAAIHTAVAYISALVFYQAATCFVNDRRLFAILAAIISTVAAAAITARIIVKCLRKKKKVTYGKKA